MFDGITGRPRQLQTLISSATRTSSVEDVMPALGQPAR
jgi:hypothetical protein